MQSPANSPPPQFHLMERRWYSPPRIRTARKCSPRDYSARPTRHCPPGTENGRDAFFSPDGKWIGFFADGKTKKIFVQGGAPVMLCDAVTERRASWGKDGNSIVALNVGVPLSRVPAEGGTPQTVTKIQGALTHRRSHLPGDEAVLRPLTCQHLVYVHEGVLFGVPFDPARLELRGTAVPRAEDLAGDPTSGAGRFSFFGPLWAGNLRVSDR
jgi:serine/threonine-protein kinase